MKRRPRPIGESIFAGGTGRHIIWVGILITILTLGGYIWAYGARGMDAFSPTLGLETFTREQLVELVGEEVVIEAEIAQNVDNWDDLDSEGRIAALEGKVSEAVTGGEEEHFAEGASEGILGMAERGPRTIAFTILAFTQMFEVMAIHAGDRISFFRTWFRENTLLFWAIISTFILQLAVIYIPFLQGAFETSPISATEMLFAFHCGFCWFCLQ